jgi:N-acetyltransferase
MVEVVTLAGQVVRLEPLTMQHVSALAEAASGPRDSFAFTLVPTDEVSAGRYIETALAEKEAGRALPFATVECQTGRVVGSTRFLDIQFWNWPEGSPHQKGIMLPDVVEIGFTWLAPSAQRTGINTEAKLLMLTHAFETWRVHRVRLSTDARNVASRTAIERLGARLDGVLRAASVGYDGALRDTAVYSIRDTEWQEAKTRLHARLRLPGAAKP